MSETKPQELKITESGIVIAAIYLPMLFERLKVIDADQKTIVDPTKAVQTLNYLCIGSFEQPTISPLANIICNRKPNESTPKESVLSDEEKETIDALIQVIIVSWQGIENSSIDQFRGNWFMRNGILHSNEEGWSLAVEKRPYDILLRQAPFNFSIVQLPWMEKPLNVTWEF